MVSLEAAIYSEGTEFTSEEILGRWLNYCAESGVDSDSVAEFQQWASRLQKEPSNA